MSPRRGLRTCRCVYCGQRSWGRACSAHLDLPQLETTYTEPAPASLEAESAETGSGRKRG